MINDMLANISDAAVADYDGKRVLFVICLDHVARHNLFDECDTAGVNVWPGFGDSLFYQYMEDYPREKIDKYQYNQVLMINHPVLLKHAHQSQVWIGSGESITPCPINPLGNSLDNIAALWM